MSIFAPIHKLTVEESHRLTEAGVLDDDDRVELLDREIIEMLGGSVSPTAFPDVRIEASEVIPPRMAA